MQADNRLIQEVEEKKKEVVTLLKSLSDKLYYEADAKKNSLETYPTRLEEAEENLKLADSASPQGWGSPWKLWTPTSCFRRFRPKSFRLSTNTTFRG